MLRKSTIILAVIAALLLGSLAARPALAATTNALDQTFSGWNGDGSSIVGSIQIPALAAGQAVTGGGSVTIMSGGDTLYSGGYTTTKLKSLDPPSANGFSAIVKETCARAFFSFFGIGFDRCSWNNGPVSTPNLTAAFQLNAGKCVTQVAGVCTEATLAPEQDLILHCNDAGTTLDIGVTLDSGVSNATALHMLTIPAHGFAAFFQNAYGQSSGTLC